MNSKSKVLKVMSVLFCALLIGACKSKPKTEPNADSQAGATVMDSQIASQPMSPDAGGSDAGIEGLVSIHFDFDTASIPAGERAKLSQNAEWIKSHPGQSVQIEGHCDARGSVEYNLALGERRAKSTFEALKSLGVEASRMSVISYGEERPLATGDDEATYAKNRRANFVPGPASVNQLSANE